MSIYYQQDGITLYHGDCLAEHTEWLGADVLVTDPPYGMNFQSGRRAQKLKRIVGDTSTRTRDSAISMWGPKPALVFGRWSITPPLGEKQRLVWWKEGQPGMGDLRMPWGTAHEDIHVLGIGWDNAITAVKREGSVIPTRGLRGGVGGEQNVTGHPTPKPVSLMEKLMEKCPPGVIADPFAGSGATLLAARNLGRTAIGVELEEEYCEIIARRLSQGVLDISL